MRLIPTKEEIDAENIPRCSDFDADCQYVMHPFSCWLGGGELGLADGYCPMIYQATQESDR